VGLTEDEMDKRQHRSFSLCSQDFKANVKEKVFEEPVSSLQHRLIQNQRSRAQSTPFFTPLDINQKRTLKTLAFDAIAELDELD
jgi:hypothetical protein